MPLIEHFKDKVEIKKQGLHGRQINSNIRKVWPNCGGRKLNTGKKCEGTELTQWHMRQPSSTLCRASRVGGMGVFLQTLRNTFDNFNQYGHFNK